MRRRHKATGRASVQAELHKYAATCIHTHIQVDCVHPYICPQIYIYIYTYTQTFTQTSPHGALLNQRRSSYAMSFHAMPCHAPNDELTRNTIRERFVPSPPTPWTLQTPHVRDFFLLKLCSAIPLPPGHKKDRGIDARKKRCRPTDLRLSTLGRKQHDIKSKGSSTDQNFAALRRSTANAMVATMHWSM